MYLNVGSNARFATSQYAFGQVTHSELHYYQCKIGIRKTKFQRC